MIEMRNPVGYKGAAAIYRSGGSPEMHVAGEKTDEVARCRDACSAIIS